MPKEPFFDRWFHNVVRDDDTMSNPGSLSQHIPNAWRQHLSSSSYEIHRDEKQIQVDVDIPGVASSDLNVEVLNTPMCVVQWSGSRKKRPSQGQPGEEGARASHTFANRLRLGSSVDCDKLAANLSHGVLRLTAPLKERDESSLPRTIPVTQRDD